MNNLIDDFYKKCPVCFHQYMSHIYPGDDEVSSGSYEHCYVDLDRTPQEDLAENLWCMCTFANDEENHDV